MRTIKKSVDFKQVYEYGIKSYTKNFLVFRKEKKNTFIRISVVVSKKLGNAVKRNRIRRKVKEALRKNIVSEERSLDIIIIPKKKVSVIIETLSEKIIFNEIREFL